jgi:prepilin-type N-terminal cleavage/methylation domain-containing protein
MSQIPSPAPTERGFSLVETLIATAVIATMTALVFQGISVNAGTTRMIADRRGAVLVAKSALDMSTVSEMADGGVGARTGVSGVFRWRITEQPYPNSLGTAPTLHLITVTVSRVGVEKPLVQLRTLRIVR